MTKVWDDSGKESLLLTFRGYHLSLNSKELGVKFWEEEERVTREEETRIPWWSSG